MSGGEVRVGEIIHGFARGVFGRDSLWCRRVEVVGSDWVVARNEHGCAEFTNDLYALTWCREEPAPDHACALEQGEQR